MDIIGLNNRVINSAFSRLDKTVKQICLVVNENKTQYLF